MTAASKIADRPPRDLVAAQSRLLTRYARGAISESCYIRCAARLRRREK